MHILKKCFQGSKMKRISVFIGKQGWPITTSGHQKPLWKNGSEKM